MYMKTAQVCERLVGENVEHESRASWTVSFEQTRSKCRCLAIIHSPMVGKKPHTNCPAVAVEGWWSGLVLHKPDLVTLWSPSQLQTPLYTKGSKSQCEAICPTTKAWVKLGHAEARWSQAHQQIQSKNKPIEILLGLCMSKCLETSRYWRNWQKKRKGQNSSTIM